ncbi:class I SAM-dependent methyltransferase [Tsukamurella sp. 8F]|uniref:class I SAM-dependent methyltransferase n=1 Tax=unclassified Tsukamurella TaxID=2633480 RepID=UPI0023B97BFD|nr:MULTISPECIES: class I SAM-dependent methyltransferase [unclassified Tsukamurella]MDF0529770.1 class I SAM-dependent methyltransferase [Tsukamurella sp. 8J]MDF0586055.1 class I SAM-dependent methyltransferase [Tsukamurella sp. 8F]
MSIDWAAWLERWDRQQAGYVSQREERFTAVFDVLEALLPPEFVAVDLGCGPGSLSARLLARFPAARAVGVDFDPAMLALGRGALGSVGGRLRLVKADLDSPAWVDEIGEARIDAVVSSTALHWLHPEPLARTYRDAHALLRPGGVLIDADHLAFGEPTLRRLDDERLEREWSDEAFAARGIETAEQWWEAFGREPGGAELVAARAAAFAGKTRQETPPDFDAHVAALRAAGFGEIGTVWQRGSDRVLVAVR